MIINLSDLKNNLLIISINCKNMNNNYKLM